MVSWKTLKSAGIEEVKLFLGECFIYNPVTGDITWKDRPVHHFTEEIRRKQWLTRCGGKIAGSVVSKRYTNYRRIKILGTSVEAHIICWIIHHGTYPRGDVDHRDGNGLNNAINNLRDEYNPKNRRLQISNNSGVVGVHWNKIKCRWVVTGDGREKYLGTFKSLFDAACERKSWEILNGYTPNHVFIS